MSDAHNLVPRKLASGTGLRHVTLQSVFPAEDVGGACKSDRVGYRIRARGQNVNLTYPKYGCRGIIVDEELECCHEDTYQ